MAYESTKIHVENLKTEIRRKDNIIDQLLLDLQKIATQSNRHPQAGVSVDHQDLASMKCNINPSKNSRRKTRHRT